MADLTAVLPRRLLLDTSNLIRLPLDFWVSELLASLDMMLVPERVYSPDLAAWTNLACLLEVFRGRSETAAAFCRAELAWINRLAEDAEAGSLRYLALAPWVNLGRLQRLGGTPTAALPYFALHRDLTARRDVRLGPCAVSASAWGEIVAANPHVHDFLWTVYVIDSLKVLLSAADYPAILRFARNLPASSDEVSAVACEGQVIALAHLGHLDEALEFAAKCATDSGLIEQLAFAIHQVSILAAGGLTDEARELAVLLTDVLLSAQVHDSAAVLSMRYLATVGSALEMLREDDAAAAIYAQGYRIADRVQDEPFRALFLRAVLRVLPKAERGAYEEALSGVLQSTDYVELRRWGAGICHASTDKVFASLEQRMWALLTAKAQGC